MSILHWPDQVVSKIAHIELTRSNIRARITKFVSGSSASGFKDTLDMGKKAI